MADISKIKLPDGTTYNIKDTSTEIGGRNLLVGSYKYTAETPFVNTTTATDGYKYLNDVHTIIQVHTGENYIVQAKTDGDWSTRHGEQPANFVTLWMVGSANLSPITYDAHQVFITAQINTNPNYLGDGKWIWTIPSNWDGKYICVRVNNYNTDGTTSVTHTYWDFKLEKGSKATDWSIAPEDQITGSGTSGYLTKFNGANTVTNGPALGSSTTTYLRNDGQWATPTDTKVTQTPTTDNHSYEVILSGSTASWNADTTKTEGVYKNSALIYNPQTNALVVRANSNPVSTDYSQVQIRPFEISCRTPNAKTRVTLGYSGLSMSNNDSTKTIDITSSSGDIETTGNIEASAISAIGISANSVTCNSISANSVTLPHQYSDTEQIVGYWIDNSPVYEITKYELSSGSGITVPALGTANLMDWTTPIQPISFKGFRYVPTGSSKFYTCWEHMGGQWQASSNKLQCYNSANHARNINGFTMQYIKV